jgi:glycerol uptake facilitator-like aquaporin
MKKYVAELIGTFFLVLTIGCTVVGLAVGALAPLAIGSTLMVMVLRADIFPEDTLIRPSPSVSGSAASARPKMWCRCIAPMP